MTISTRLRTETTAGAEGPRFFIGCPSPSRAIHFDRAMISINRLRDRKADFSANEWLLDCGAFSNLSRFGCHHLGVKEYARQVERWSCCGRMLAAVSQDWMCEPAILARTGLSVSEHQRLTIERYDLLLKFVSQPVLPVLQGYRVSEYLSHVDAYGERLTPGHWVGVGSVCKRNARPAEIADLLAAIKNKRPDLRLHGFGLKLTALESPQVRSVLYRAFRCQTRKIIR